MSFLIKFIVLATAFGAGVKNGESSHDDTSMLRPWMFLSSKTPYYQQQLGERESMPSHCRLVHLNHLGTYFKVKALHSLITKISLTKF